MQSNSGARISPENKKRFSPFFVAMINGKQEMVTLGNFLNDVPRYINSDMAHMYENEDELRAKFAKRSNKAKNFVKLDMSKAKRGLSFDPNNRKAKKTREAEQAEHMAGLIRDVAEKRKRVEAAFLEKQRKAQAEAAQAEAIEKAKAEARAEVLAEVEAQRKAEAESGKETKAATKKTTKKTAKVVK